MLTVYLDMDGVLADFDKKTLELIGKQLRDFPTSKEGWDAISHVQNIYEILDPMPDANQLVEGVFELQRQFNYNFDIGVLTAIPRIGSVPNARLHKRAWIQRYYPELIFNFNIGPHAVHKQLHARKGDVLIDDSEKNIPQWNSVGGFGIFHTSAEKSLAELEQYLRNI